MLLTEVSYHIKCDQIYKPDKKKLNVNYIFTNSLNVKKSSIFVIDSKVKLRRKYIKEAISMGAIAILTNKYLDNINVTQYIVSNIYLSLSILLNKLNSIKPLNSIAVTGTNGKTSVAWYVSQICFYNNLDIKTYGTLGYFINLKKKKETNLTTPELEILHQTAFTKKKNLYNYVFEASSHAISQNRLRNFPINIAAITNISQDHLDYHKKFENYKNTKFKLFTSYLDQNGFAILNDKIIGINILKKKLIKKKIITYGKKNSDIFFEKYKGYIKIKFFNKKYFLKFVKFSSIEIENITCAIACCFCLNIKIDNILKVLKKISNPPGRLEEIKQNNKNFKILIDYAHTPDALKQVLKSLTLKNKKPNLVFGCGGNRDKSKREKMGVIADKYADKVYVTDDNPRREDPANIRKSILIKCKKAIEFNDRKLAIIKAIKDMKKNDILIIAGKGHEKIQIFKNFSKNFDDLKIAKNELKKNYTNDGFR